MLLSGHSFTFLQLHSVFLSLSFKDRYRNHKKSFDDIKYENETELSKHVWKLKLSDKQYKINWSILSQASSIKAGGNNCSLCLEEKLQILRSYNSTSVLNKRSELFTKCVHARRFRAGQFKRITLLHCLNDCLLHET